MSSQDRQTYYNTSSVLRHQSNLAQRLPDETISVWFSIIFYQFTAWAGYMSEPDFKDGIFEMRCFHWTNIPPPATRPLRLHFLTVHVYPPSRQNYENDAQLWQNAIENLRISLCGHYHNGRGASYRNRTFAALGVGRYVRFFEFKHGTENMVALYGERAYHLGEDHQEIQIILDIIRANYISFPMTHGLPSS